jgi:hypothetical protein
VQRVLHTIHTRHTHCALYTQHDRTTFVTPEFCQWGDASVEKHEDLIEHNFFLMGPYFGGNYGLDFDDGTRNMTTANNVIYGGGNKNYIGQVGQRLSTLSSELQVQAPRV